MVLNSESSGAQGENAVDRADRLVGTDRRQQDLAKIVMEDHNMGDLKDSCRVGESMAPKLPPDQQRRADAMFAGGNVKRMIPGAASMARRALAGGYRDNGYVDPVSTLSPKYKPPVSIVNKE